MVSPNPLIPHADELASTIEMSNRDIRTQAAQRLLEEVRGSVVQVMVITDPEADKKFCADGFFINDGTEVVTSNFLIQNAEGGKSIEVVTSTGEKFAAQIEKQENGQNEVILKLPGAKPGGHKSLTLGSSDDLVEGEALYLYGHKDVTKQPILAAGRMKSHYRQKAEDGEKHQFIDCVMPIEIGLSGSPLLNSEGEVVGMYRADYESKSGNKNVLVKFDDVYELQKMTNPNMKQPKFADVVDLDNTSQQEEVMETTEPVAELKKPSAEQLAAIGSKFGNVDKPTVIEFQADWCGYCKKMEPLLDGAEKTYGKDLKVLHVNFDTEKDLVRAYGVTGLPTTIYIGVSPEGEILYQETSMGALSEDAFQSHIDKLMKDKMQGGKSP